MIRTRTLLFVAVLAVVLPGPRTAQAGEPFLADDPRLSRHQGQWFLEGTAFSGELARHHEDGTLRSLGHYENGLRHGLSRTWFPDGQIQSEREFDKGVLTGESREYWESGQLRFLQQFQAGRESGLQQGWHQDGLPAFAYQYRDGRRYGVMGSKPCYSVQLQEQKP